ncbi:unnamed protein product [Mytilus edulis]|uniref:ZSWIM1/3 RNaseH-like domain-containing protein n=1 Tax=Mytilus edulis TaxID=6550 RepID=A0A8S3UGL4_MYTED|nr:unnamed protein product [Mytilus edulis]
MAEKNTTAKLMEKDLNKVGVSEDGKFLVVKSIEDHHNHVISKDATVCHYDRRQSEVAAICLLNSEEKPVLQHLIKCFQKHNPDSSGIKVIMADKDIVERDVFKEEFPDASLLICKFHVLRTFNREITTEKMGISSAQRYVALELIQKLVHSSSEEDYNANLKLIETTCPRQIFNYIDTNWHNIRNEWVLG